MKLTKEQKLLKAFVVNFIKKHDYEVDFTKDDWFKQVCAKPFVGNEDQDLLLACKEYLDQFVSVNEKVELDWTPEVGKLYILNEYAKDIYEYYKSIANVEVGEICELMGETDWSERIYRMKTKAGIFEITDKCAAKYLTPIAELEGLKEGEHAYTYGDDGNIHSFVNEGKFQFHDSITVRNTQGGYCFNITLDGYFTILSNKQLFYRTADRAERFGRGDA